MVSADPLTLGSQIRQTRCRTPSRPDQILTPDPCICSVGFVFVFNFFSFWGFSVCPNTIDAPPIVMSHPICCLRTPNRRPDSNNLAPNRPHPSYVSLFACAIAVAKRRACCSRPCALRKVRVLGGCVVGVLLVTAAFGWSGFVLVRLLRVDAGGRKQNQQIFWAKQLV